MFQVQVDAQFVFTDDSIKLITSGMEIDLDKIESLEEWRITLYGIAANSLSGIAARAKAKPAPAAPTAKPSEGVTKMEDEFRRQQEDIASRTAKLQDDVTKQYRELQSVYESAAHATGRKPAAENVRPG
jgi:hypothetical protein